MAWMWCLSRSALSDHLPSTSASWRRGRWRAGGRLVAQRRVGNRGVRGRCGARDRYGVPVGDSAVASGLGRRQARQPAVVRGIGGQSRDHPPRRRPLWGQKTSAPASPDMACSVRPAGLAPGGTDGGTRELGPLFFMPRRMDADTAADFAAWVARVHTRPRPSMDVAARRMISAMAERKDSADALVDLVIVWENLFGIEAGRADPSSLRRIGLAARFECRGKGGHQFTCRAALLASQRHRPRQSRNRIREAGQALAETRSLTVDALRALFEQRPEVLMLEDGDARSRHLMMGRCPRAGSTRRVRGSG